MIMKRLFLSLALLGATAVPALAGIGWGIEAGLNLSKLNFKNVSTNFQAKKRAGFFIGPKVSFSLLGFGGDAAILYNNRSLGLADGASKTMHSIEVPINARYTFGLGSKLAIYASTGPQFGFNVGGKKWSQLVGSEADTFEMKNANVSWNFGVGIRAMSHVEVGLGYNLAFTKAAKILERAGVDVSAQNQNFKTNSFTVHVAYLF